MSDSGAHSALTAPFSAFEPNVLLAGLEGGLVAWVVRIAFTGKELAPQLPDSWRWSHALYLLAALLGVLILGLIVEGIAGLVEILTTRHLWGKQKGKLRHWYASRTNQPPDWGPGQRWIWKSELANREFARRRLRLLFCRNTALCFLALSVALAAAIVVRGPSQCGWLLAADIVGGALLVWLFGWLWIDAHKGWNKAVQDAGEIGPP